MKIEPLKRFIARIIKLISMGTNVNLLSNNPFLKESAKQINFNFCTPVIYHNNAAYVIL